MIPTTSAWDAFIAIRDHIERHPELVSTIHSTFLFKISDPDSAWLVDLRNGRGAVLEDGVGADCILEISESDFVDMIDGRHDLATVVSTGKLRITGDTKTVQKLAFLQALDPAQATAAVAKARAAGEGPSVKPVAATTRSASASRIFGLLHKRFTETPDLADEVQAILVVQVTDPESTWTIDAIGPTPAIRRGASSGATATLTLADTDLDALAAGSVSARDLLQQGKLRVAGDASVANRLGFFKKL